ncbi:hypothetical protein B0H15DRAFT_143396 [Mycena belliarum]|uniref:Secreted protein n=1 Tax=Mycena belliarum TaxID=1033014 RepID=A0AAD6XRA8_9AGAR|nr:hypothetical protein B0H15DRAFT_143396 [Mycena belliae]
MAWGGTLTLVCCLLRRTCRFPYSDRRNFYGLIACSYCIGYNRSHLKLDQQNHDLVGCCFVQQFPTLTHAYSTSDPQSCGLDYFPLLSACIWSLLFNYLGSALEA